MKELAAQYILVETVDPDTIGVKDDERCADSEAEWFEVIQLGVWWWKKFAIGYLIPGMAAGGVSSDHWKIVSNTYHTRAEARVALKSGMFRHPYPW